MIREIGAQLPYVALEEQSPLITLLEQQQRQEQEAYERLRMVADEHIYLLGEMAGTLKQEQKELKKEGVHLQEQITTLTLTLEAGRAAYAANIVTKIGILYQKYQCYLNFVNINFVTFNVPNPDNGYSFENGRTVAHRLLYQYSHCAIKTPSFEKLYDERLDLLDVAQKEGLTTPKNHIVPSHSHAIVELAPSDVIQRSGSGSFIQRREAEINSLLKENAIIKINNERFRGRIREIEEMDKKIMGIYRNKVNVAVSILCNNLNAILQYMNKEYSSLQASKDYNPKLHYTYEYYKASHPETMGTIKGWEEVRAKMQPDLNELVSLANTLRV